MESSKKRRTFKQWWNEKVRKKHETDASSSLHGPAPPLSIKEELQNDVHLKKDELKQLQGELKRDHSGVKLRKKLFDIKQQLEYSEMKEKLKNWTRRSKNIKKQVSKLKEPSSLKKNKKQISGLQNKESKLRKEKFEIDLKRKSLEMKVERERKKISEIVDIIDNWDEKEKDSKEVQRLKELLKQQKKNDKLENAMLEREEVLNKKMNVVDFQMDVIRLMTKYRTAGMQEMMEKWERTNGEMKEAINVRQLRTVQNNRMMMDIQLKEEEINKKKKDLLEKQDELKEKKEELKNVKKNHTSKTINRPKIQEIEDEQPPFKGEVRNPKIRSPPKKDTSMNNNAKNSKQTK